MPVRPTRWLNGGRIDRVLAGQAVGDEEHFVRAAAFTSAASAIIASSRWCGRRCQYDHVVAAEPGGLDGAPRNLHRRLAGDTIGSIDADLPAGHREAAPSPRDAWCRGSHQHLAPHLLIEAPRDLGGGGGAGLAPPS
jgi:hypothetical protein